jgi:hypothetical protein
VTLNTPNESRLIYSTATCCESNHSNAGVYAFIGVPPCADGEVGDAVFGNVDEEGGPNYFNVGWLRASVLTMKTEVGLGERYLA